VAWVRFRKKEMPGGLWTKCPSCAEMMFQKDLTANLQVCPKCKFHMTATVDERVLFTLDEGSFEELYTDLKPVDRLKFRDKSDYGEKLAETAKKAKRLEGMTIGTGRIFEREVIFGVMNFKFLGGSMGVVVGEKVTLAVELARERRLPLILICASGGARMHEGALSLMQMAKTCSSLARFGDEGGLYLSVLTNPTTGGVTASFATMADVILAEPGALIGFAGPRVIQNTIKQELPEGFQRSEFLMARGQIDCIVSRDQLKVELFRLIEYLKPRDAKAGSLADLIAAAVTRAGKDSNGAPQDAEERPAAGQEKDGGGQKQKRKGKCRAKDTAPDRKSQNRLEETERSQEKVKKRKQ